jgi:hypothetical protein
LVVSKKIRTFAIDKGKDPLQKQLNITTMYKLNYYSKQTESLSNKGQNYEYLGMGEFFRLRRNALHYLFDIVQNEYKAMGFTTEVRAGSLYCYKSEKTAQGDRKVTEILIKVEK